MPGVAQTGINQFREIPVFVRMGAVVVVEGNAEIGKVLQMLLVHAFDQGFRSNSLALRAQHDRRAVRVVGANVGAFVAAQFLKAHPDVRLYVLEHVADVNRTVGIG